MSLIAAFLQSRESHAIELGQGSSRRVFATPSIPGVVFKQALSDWAYGTNLEEAKNWKKYSASPEKAKFLAPTLEVTEQGSWLAMVRTEKIPEYELYEKLRSLPLWIGDRHGGNIGLLKGQLVSHDYAAFMRD